MVLSGAPQWSVLEPLLFVLYINGLYYTLGCPCMVFANDTESLKEITYVPGMNLLQNDLHQMVKLSKTWILQFHPGKCVVISVGIWWNIIQVYPYDIYISTGLEHVLEDKDIGIIIDSELTFESHIEAKLGQQTRYLAS